MSPPGAIVPSCVSRPSFSASERPNSVLVDGRLGVVCCSHDLGIGILAWRLGFLLRARSGGFGFVQEVCGSPGEVANDPWRGHQYTFLQDHHGALDETYPTTKAIQLRK